MKIVKDYCHLTGKLGRLAQFKFYFKTREANKSFESILFTTFPDMIVTFF